jgi:transcriptional regulator of acetoin/glycerol metabolism
VVEKIVGYQWPGNVRELKNVVERIVVRSRSGCVELHDLPPAITGPSAAPVAFVVGAAAASEQVVLTPRNPREIYERMVEQRESFWSAVYAPFMARDLTRDDVRAIVAAGLQHTRGDYKAVVGLFNMPPADHKRFLNFLRKHDCHMPFQMLRITEVVRPEIRAKVS